MGHHPPARPLSFAGQPAPEQTLMGRGTGNEVAWSNLLPDFDKASGLPWSCSGAGETSAKGPGMWLQARSCTRQCRSKMRGSGQAGQLPRRLPTAADIIGADRGIPANAALRSNLQTKLDASQKVEYAYIDRISKAISGDS